MRLPSEFLSYGWCQHHMAKNSQGDVCMFRSLDASSWCMQGALHRAYYAGGITWSEMLGLELWLQDQCAQPGKPPTIGSLVVWNDDPERSIGQAIALMCQAEATVLGPRLRDT